MNGSNLSRRSCWSLWILIAALCEFCFLPQILAAETTNNYAQELQVADSFYVAIPKNSMGRDYLFSGSLIAQAGSPTSKGLAGKIVHFELFPDGVDMYESTKGLVVTEDLPAKRLLASFSILKQDADKVVIDFNKGMRRVFMEEWTEGSFLDFATHDSVMEVPEGRVFDIHVQEGQLVIRQSIQIRSRELNPDLEQRFEARYFISPYKAGSFPGKEPSRVDQRYVKFFETEGQYELGTGRLSSRIDRFDTNKPIVFYYSANTPAEYVDAVKDGILYWNKAFGRELVQARKSPNGVTAPDAQYNIVQWVPWDRAGFAYADVLVDPLTGESRHGQVYMTTAFSFLGKARARELLRAMEEMAKPKTEPKKGEARKSGGSIFRSSIRCEMDSTEMAAQMAHGLTELLASKELTDEAVLRVSQDYVRETISHEVGHVLGLRHNFAGSISGTLTARELEEWFKSYLLGQKLDDYTNKITSTTVMDYNVFKSAVFIGWRMRNGLKTLPYDTAAIQYGYFDNPSARTNKLLFGTDEDTMRYGDVKTFDYGTDPVVADYLETAQTVNLLPNQVIETYIRARAPQNPADRVPLEQVDLSRLYTSVFIANHFGSALKWFRADVRSLKVENDFDYIGELNHKERQEAHWKYLKKQIEDLGGVDRALFSELPEEFKLDFKKEPEGAPVITRISSSNLTSRLEKLLASTNYAEFIGLDEKKYSFTKEEKELIVRQGGKYFENLEKNLILRICKQLEDAPRDLGNKATGDVAEDDIVSQLEHRIIDIAKQVITAKDETNRLEGRLDKSIVVVKTYKYDLETRLAAAKTMSDGTGSFKNWADDAKGELYEQLKHEIEESLNLSHFKDFKVSMLSRPLRDWYQQQLEVLSMLPPSAPGPGGSSSPPLPSR